MLPGPASASTASRSSSASATHPSVPVKPGRATCMKMALPRPGTGGASIVSQDHDNVVDRIRPPQLFMRGGIGQGHWPIVSRVGGIITPSVIGASAWTAGRSGGLKAIGAVKHAAQGKRTHRSTSVALALVPDNTALAQRATPRAAIVGTKHGGVRIDKQLQGHMPVIARRLRCWPLSSCWPSRSAGRLLVPVKRLHHGLIEPTRHLLGALRLRCHA